MWNQIPSIIQAAGAGPLAFLALGVIALAYLILHLFKQDHVSVRVCVFLLVFVLICSAPFISYLIGNGSQRSSSNKPPSPQRDNQPIPSDERARQAAEILTSRLDYPDEMRKEEAGIVTANLLYKDRSSPSAVHGIPLSDSFEYTLDEGGKLTGGNVDDELTKLVAGCPRRYPGFIIELVIFTTDMGGLGIHDIPHKFSVVFDRLKKLQESLWQKPDDCAFDYYIAHNVEWPPHVPKSHVAIQWMLFKA